MSSSSSSSSYSLKEEIHDHIQRAVIEQRQQQQRYDQDSSSSSFSMSEYFRSALSESWPHKEAIPILMELYRNSTNDDKAENASSEEQKMCQGGIAYMMANLIYFVQAGKFLKDLDRNGPVKGAAFLADCYYLGPPPTGGLEAWQQVSEWQAEWDELVELVEGRCKERLQTMQEEEKDEDENYLNKIRIINDIFFTELGCQASNGNDNIPQQTTTPPMLQQSMTHWVIEHRRTANYFTICFLYREVFKRVFNLPHSSGDDQGENKRISRAPGYLRWNGVWTCQIKTQPGSRGVTMFVDLTSGNLLTWDEWKALVLEKNPTADPSAWKKYPSPFSVVTTLNEVIEILHAVVLAQQAQQEEAAPSTTQQQQLRFEALLNSKRILAAKAALRHLITRQDVTLEEAIISRMEIDTWWPF